MIDALHSYDPFDILDLIYRLIRSLINGDAHSALLGLYHRYSPILIFISIMFSFALIVLIFYVIFKINGIDYKQRKLLKAITEEKKKEKIMKNEKWEKVMEHIESDNANDWRLAILEADIALGEMLDKRGYIGEGIGEQLKSVDKNDFTSIDDAWEAHKIRNLIAHEGASFMITEREAKRVIGLYKKVFEEFDFI